ncbi:NADPH-dependent FMN reductase [Antrihabitans sp. NCIMB 15449]|uniref:NADPH-dependent FMN reductase n=1 Tax=Antrihabitans spumae TaxID=3373370 RepID=A0ABW7JFF5_9NOCA
MTGPGRLRLEVIIGSVRAGRKGPKVAEWFLRQASEATEFDVGVLDLATAELPDNLVVDAHVEAFRGCLDAADAFVVVTPEYNHGYPGALKTAFDNAKFEWRAKPVGFVSYGGMSGGLRATEQLRLVVAELHMVSIRETVSLHQVRKAFDADGELIDGAAFDAAARLLAQLAWWATMLRAARTVEPYPG